MKKLILLSMVAIFWACSPQPMPINYGSDLCHSCKMTIVDNQHAGQAVTSKGKVFKFDAIECLLPHILNNPNKEYSYLLVNDYENPSELIPVESSSFLISTEIPSPMGGYLSAFSNELKAKNLASLKNGVLYNWNGITKLYQSKIANQE